MRIFIVPASSLADEAGARWLLLLSATFLIAAVLLVLLAGWHGGFIAINDAGRAMSDGVAANLTQMGDTLFALSLFLLLAKRHPALLWHAVVAAIIAALLSRGIKALMAEPRPVAVLNLELFRQVGPLLRRSSFPSGHTVTALVSAATLACYVSWPWRALLLLLALLISASRVIVGAHWPIDVLGGAAIGVLSAYLGLLVARRWQWGLQSSVHRALVAILAACTLLQLIHRPDYLDARPMVIAVSVAALALTAWHYFIAARWRVSDS